MYYCNTLKIEHENKMRRGLPVDGDAKELERIKISSQLKSQLYS